MGNKNGCNFFNEDIEKEIVSKYMSGVSAKKLCEIYGFKTNKSITDKVKKYGFDIKDAKPSEEKPYMLFSLSKIDTPSKAYILGVIMTDGNIDEETGHFEINSTDEDLMQFISSYIQKDYKSYESYKTSENDISRHKTIHRIVFKNKQLTDELKRFGMENNRSTNMKSPKFNADEIKYLPYVIRGMIDGDGWVRKDGKEFYICSGSEEFAYWVKYTLENFLYMQSININMLERDWNGRPSYIWYVRTAIDKNINILKTIVYDTHMGMSRKFKLIHQITNEPSENIMEDTYIN